MENKEENSKEEEEKLEDILDKEDQEKDTPPLVDFSSDNQVKKKSLKKIKPIDLDTFQEFLQMPDELTSPVLEQVEQAPETTTLEQWASTGSPTQTQNNEEDPFKYSAGNSEEDTKKYMASNSQITSEAAGFDPTKLGREKTKIQEVGFIHSEEQTPGLDQEKYVVPDRTDTKELGKENPFQTRETKGKKMDYEPLH